MVSPNSSPSLFAAIEEVFANVTWPLELGNKLSRDFVGKGKTDYLITEITVH